jgi:hypothetical protein
MSLTLRFLGTSAARPTVERGVSSIALIREGETMLIDCGEGTQRQMMRYGISFNFSDIFFTHFHGDHFFGVIGLLRTLALQGRTEPLRLWGPRGAQRMLRRTLEIGMDRMPFPIDITELSPDEPVRRNNYAMVPFAAAHGGALGASRSIARVKCNAPGNGQGNGHGSLPAGMIELLVVPAVAEALLGDNLGALHLDNLLREVVVSYLDQYRLLTTTLSVREPRYRGIKVSAEIVCSEYSRPEIVRLRVAETLRAFLSPLPLPGLSDQVRAMLPDDWKGWPFGKPLYLSEIYSLIQQVPGVKHVVEVKLSEREVTPSKERLPGEITSGNPPVEPKLIEARRIAIPADTLFCSLDHEIQDVSL